MKNKAHYFGTITIPASKSQTIRAFLIALVSNGISRIKHPLLSSDTLSALSVIEQLGCKIERKEDEIIIDSTSLKKEKVTLDCGNSGTTSYLLLPLLASLETPITITGDEQMVKRPFLPLLKAIEDLGGKIESNNGYMPLTITGPLKGGKTTIECKTSQYLSALLLASPLALNDTTIECSLLYEKPYVDMTQQWLDKEKIEYEISSDKLISKIKGRQTYHPFFSYIEGDYSSSSFFFVLACLHHSTITVKGLDKDSKQGDKEILSILSKMGAEVELGDNCVTVKGPEKLKGGTFSLNAIPDTLPSLAVLGAFVEGDLILNNVSQARIKETDRIAVMKEELEKMGADIEEREDGLVIHGKGFLKGAKVSGHNDHRVIMALYVASTAAEGETVIDDTSAVSVTFPTFFTLMDELKKEEK